MMHPYTKAMKQEFEATRRPQREFDAFIEEKRRPYPGDVRRVFEPEFVREQVSYCHYTGDNMQPTIDEKAMLSIVEVSSYQRDGVYVIGTETDQQLYRCELIQADVHMHSENDRYPARIVTLDWFNGSITGMLLGITRMHKKV